MATTAIKSAAAVLTGCILFTSAAFAAGSELSQAELQELLQNYSNLSAKEREALKGPVGAALARLKKRTSVPTAASAPTPKEPRSANAAVPLGPIDLKKENDIRTDLLIRESFGPIA